MRGEKVDVTSADMDARHEAIIIDLYGEMCGLVDEPTDDFYHAYRRECEKRLLTPWTKRKAVQRAGMMYGLHVIQRTVFAER